MYLFTRNITMDVTHLIRGVFPVITKIKEGGTLVILVFN